MEAKLINLSNEELSQIDGGVNVVNYTLGIICETGIIIARFLFSMDKDSADAMNKAL